MKHVQAAIALGLIIISMLTPRVYAQQSPQIWVGGFGGVDIGNLSIHVREKQLQGMTSRTGLALGGEFDYFFSDNLGLSAQLAFVEKGGTRSIEEGATWTYALSYLQVPLLLKATLATGDLKPILFAGPVIGIKIGSTLRAKNGSGLDTTITIPDSIFTTTAFGMMFGLGVTYAIGPATMLFLFGAYDLGLTNLNAQFGTNTFFTSDDDEYYSSDIRINLGILVGIGK